jgi:hypothetical protein
MTTQPHCPRDLVGYAEQPPHPRWPGGAGLAGKRARAMHFRFIDFILTQPNVWICRCKEIARDRLMHHSPAETRT